MANAENKHKENIEGAWFCTDGEDDSGEGCTACSVCYTGAEDFFASDESGFAFVKKQPETEEDIALCQEQLEACPVESIGSGT